MFFSRLFNRRDATAPKSEPHNSDAYIYTPWKERFNTIIEAMGLPIPSEDEQTESVDGGQMIFLNIPGCVIRVFDKGASGDNPIIQHPHILQPLGSRRIESLGLRVDINPGLACPPTSEDRDNTVATLEKDGLEIWDTKTINFGYVPTTDHLVLLDLGGLNRLFYSSEKVKKILEDKKPIGAQELYSPLRAAFDDAWPKDQDQPDSEKMSAFWQKCMEFKAQNKLQASWATAEWRNFVDAQCFIEEDYKNASGGSRYAARCARARTFNSP